VNNDTVTKILLLIVGGIITLIVGQLSKIWGRPRYRITYSISRDPIISVSGDLPEEVRRQLPEGLSLNVSKVRVLASNTGNKTVREANMRAVLDLDAELLRNELKTVPDREVLHGNVEQIDDNELRVPAVTLQRNQSLELILFIRSKGNEEVKVYWSGGGNDDVQWNRGSGLSELTIERHIVAIIKNFIFAEVIPALVPILASPFSLFRDNIFLIPVAGGATVLSALARLYFLLRIVPHAVAVTKYWVRTDEPRGQIRISDVGGSVEIRT